MKIDHRHENSGRFPFTEAKAGSRQNLIKCRLERNMSQTEVAEYIGCDQSSYSLIESNRRTGNKFKHALSVLFAKPADWLMEVDNTEPDWDPYLKRSGKL